MMKRNVVVSMLVGLVVLVGLTACMKTEDVGYVTIGVGPQRGPMAPKWIPAETTEVRVRIWNTAGVDLLMHFPTTGSTSTVPVPAGVGYVFDAVSFKDEVALTGGRTAGIVIEPGVTIPVKIELRQWTASYSIPAVVEPGAKYVVSCDLTAGDAPVTDIFSSSGFHVSDVDFLNDPFPPVPLQTCASKDGTALFNGNALTAPLAKGVLYAMVSFRLTASWREPGEGMLWVEVPARTLNEPLWEIPVGDPPGGVDITFE